MKPLSGLARPAAPILLMCLLVMPNMLKVDRRVLRESRADKKKADRQQNWKNLLPEWWLQQWRHVERNREMRSLSILINLTSLKESYHPLLLIDTTFLWAFWMYTHHWAMAHHHAADDLSKVIPSKQLPRILPALARTLQACVACHRVYKR